MVLAQDERLFRNAVLGSFVPIERKVKIPAKYFYKTNSDMYRLDITGNGYKEGIVFEKFDGEDWVHFHDNSMKRLKSFPLSPVGIKARAYKIELKQIKTDTRVLLIYYYEGYSNYLDFHGSARLYIVTIKNGDIANSVMTKGPQYFEESEEIFKRYYLKRFKIYAKDLDGDGVKELIFTKHLMTTILILDKDGKWIKPKNN